MDAVTCMRDVDDEILIPENESNSLMMIKKISKILIIYD